jgi:hypothetical protein
MHVAIAEHDRNCGHGILAGLHLPLPVPAAPDSHFMVSGIDPPVPGEVLHAAYRTMAPKVGATSALGGAPGEWEQRARPDHGVVKRSRAGRPGCRPGCDLVRPMTAHRRRVAHAGLTR